MSLRINPEYDKLLPRMMEEEFNQLKESIRTEGQHYAIIVNEDLEVLDGHHRFRACIELEIEPDFEVRKFESKLLEKKFVIEANLRRRHLNNFQLVELAVPLLEIEKAIAKRKGTKSHTDNPDMELDLNLEKEENKLEKENAARAREEVAKRAGVSTRTLERGKKIIENATEDDKQRLREGKTSISKVYQEIVAEQRPHKEMEADQMSQHEISARHLQNIEDLLQILEKMRKQELFCPECEHNMFECSQCHKTIKELLKTKGKVVSK